MTIARLLVLTLAATALLVAAVMANVAARPADEVRGLVQIASISEATVDAIEVDERRPVASPTTPGAATVQRFAEIEAPTWVEIPSDLISTPTPDAATPVPLPFLTNIPSSPRDGSVLYLTFDDGPDPVYTSQVLDLLAHYGAKATFFVLGSSVDRHPSVVQRIVAEGHAVGNHTYGHEALPLETTERMFETLEATNGALARAVGRTTNCLRPPYGALDRARFDLLSSHGYTVHMWEVDSEDWRLNDGYAIASTVLADADLGDRILFHDGPNNRAATVAALRSVLEVLTARGVQFHALPC